MQQIDHQGINMRFEVNETVSRPLDDVFTIITNFDYFLDKIDSDVTLITRTSSSDVGIGTTWHQELKGPPGMTIKIDMEITSFDSPNGFNARFEGNGFSGTVGFALAEDGDGTAIRLEIHTTTSGIGWLFYPMIRWDMPRREKRRLENFKRLVESGELTAEGVRVT